MNSELVTVRIREDDYHKGVFRQIFSSIHYRKGDSGMKAMFIIMYVLNVPSEFKSKFGPVNCSSLSRGKFAKLQTAKDTPFQLRLIV